jgi:hypothetical protein
MQFCSEVRAMYFSGKILTSECVNMSLTESYDLIKVLLKFKRIIILATLCDSPKLQ